MEICFFPHLLALVNGAVMNVCVQVFEHLFSILLGIYLGVELLGHMALFEEVPECFPKWLCNQQYRSVQISPHSHQHLFSSVQSLSHIWLFATPWTAVRQASLSITNSQSLLKLMSIVLVMPSQPCHPLLSPSPLVFNLSQQQGLFQWVSSSHQVAKVLEFQLQHESFQWIFRTDFL